MAEVKTKYGIPWALFVRQTKPSREVPIAGLAIEREAAFVSVDIFVRGIGDLMFGWDWPRRREGRTWLIRTPG